MRRQGRPTSRNMLVTTVTRRALDDRDGSQVVRGVILSCHDEGLIGGGLESKCVRAD